MSVVALVAQRERDLALELSASSTTKPNHLGHFTCWLFLEGWNCWNTSVAHLLDPCLFKEVVQHPDPTQVPDYFELDGLESPRGFTVWFLGVKWKRSLATESPRKIQKLTSSRSSFSVSGLSVYLRPMPLPIMPLGLGKGMECSVTFTFPLRFVCLREMLLLLLLLLWNTIVFYFVLAMETNK